MGKARKAHSGHALISHPTQKPIALTMRLIAAAKPLSEPRPMVLIPFSGSGAESVAAIMEGCDFIGFDLTPEYARMGNAWSQRILNGL